MGPSDENGPDDPHRRHPGQVGEKNAENHKKNNSFYSGGFQERQAGRVKREEEAGNRETLSTWEEAAGVAVRRQGQMEDIRVARELLSQPSIETGIRDEEEWGYGGRRMAGGGGAADTCDIHDGLVCCLPWILDTLADAAEF